MVRGTQRCHSPQTCRCTHMHTNTHRPGRFPGPGIGIHARISDVVCRASRGQTLSEGGRGEGKGSAVWSHKREGPHHIFQFVVRRILPLNAHGRGHTARSAAPHERWRDAPRRHRPAEAGRYHRPQHRPDLLGCDGPVAVLVENIKRLSVHRGWRGEGSRWPSPARGSTLRRAERECKRTCIPPPAPPRSCACALVHRSALSRASQPGPLVPQSPPALFGSVLVFRSRHSSEAESGVLWQ